jgi:hypothetical protein
MEDRLLLFPPRHQEKASFILQPIQCHFQCQVWILKAEEIESTPYNEQQRREQQHHAIIQKYHMQ